MITTRKEAGMLTASALFMLVLAPVAAFALSAVVFSTARYMLDQF